MKFLLLICMFTSLSTYASNSTGYWAKYEVITEYESGQIEKSYQIKTIISSDDANNNYTVELVNITLDGSTIDKSKEVINDFITPAVGLELVLTCDELGGNVELAPLKDENIEICSINSNLAFAAVPFGSYRFDFELSVDLPGGGSHLTLIKNTLIDYGKH